MVVSRCMAGRILLVEDDQKLADMVCEFLRGKGFELHHEASGEHVEARVAADPPDLIVLDLLLPAVAGLEVCRRLRPRYRGPIIMLTALSEEIDEVLGLELGADDYLVKPVRPRVLLARIQALLRRALPGGDAHLSGAPAATLACGSLLIDPAAREVRRDGHKLDLTTAEFELLTYLAQRAGQIVRREQISRDLRGLEWDGLDRTIDIRIARLRRKLGDCAKSPELIKSVRGEGYVLVARR
jgi:two-component system response regulator RstA